MLSIATPGAAFSFGQNNCPLQAPAYVCNARLVAAHARTGVRFGELGVALQGGIPVLCAIDARRLKVGDSSRAVGQRIRRAKEVLASRRHRKLTCRSVAASNASSAPDRELRQRIEPIDAIMIVEAGQCADPGLSEF